MANNIKSFSDFKSASVSDVNENWVSDLLGYAGGAFSDVLKGKASAYLMSFFGIGEQSIFSKLVQNFVEQIPIADLTKIIFAGKANSAYLAPKMADATIEFLSEKGLDGIAQDLHIDPSGWIYRTLSEIVSNQARRENFREQLVGFYLQAFNGFESPDMDEFKNSLSPMETRSLEKGLEDVARRSGGDINITPSEGGADLVTNFLSGLVGNGQSMQSLGLSTGGTIQ
jgi:hypothetical protein